MQHQAQEYEAKLRERLGKFNINEVLRQANLQALFRSMAAADSEITLEKLRALPYDVSRVLQETVLNASFLPQRKTSKPGSITAANFKA